jgi:hypothetical protein
VFVPLVLVLLTSVRHRLSARCIAYTVLHNCILGHRGLTRLVSQCDFLLAQLVIRARANLPLCVVDKGGGEAAGCVKCKVCLQ